MGSYRFDDSRHPLVMVTMKGQLTDAQFSEYLERLDGNLQRRERCVVVVDALNATNTPASQRKMQADWMANNEALLGKYTLATVMVIGSPVMRGILTAILWLQPIPCPWSVVGTRAAALRKADEYLREAGLPPVGDAAVG